MDKAIGLLIVAGLARSGAGGQETGAEVNREAARAAEAVPESWGKIMASAAPECELRYFAVAHDVHNFHDGEEIVPVGEPEPSGLHWFKSKSRELLQLLTARNFIIN